MDRTTDLVVVPQERQLPEKLPNLDRALHASIGRITRGLSPIAMMSAYLDWSMHLLNSPSKQAELASHAATNMISNWNMAINGAMGILDPGCEAALRQDKRFRDPAWLQYPFSQIAHTFLMQQDWWDAATRNLHGVDPRTERMVNFGARQILDMMSPSNNAFTNPVVLQRARDEGGRNFVRGFQNYLDDFNQVISDGARKHPGFRC